MHVKEGEKMGLNETPSANRLHIGFFGRRNAGKSSVVNAVTNQELSVVSEQKGTTTDPVTKSMELLPLGPVLIIDTPGFDDSGDLGELRVKKTRQILNKTDIAILVMDATEGLLGADRELIELFKAKDIPYILAYNKCDLLSVSDMKRLSKEDNAILISAKDRKNIDQLKEKIGLMVERDEKKYIVSDLLCAGDVVVLVTPIDESAPKGRLILPQQQVLRELLDADIISIVVQVQEVETALKLLSQKPRLVITDSQAFKQVAAVVPEDIPLTSFSILMARYKGFLKIAAEGALLVDTLKGGERILISEGCTHHRQCKDIGTVKLPGWLSAYTGKDFEYSFTSGMEFPEKLDGYDMIIHCGGCMLNEREMKYRMKTATDQGVPFTNYGMVIALTQGILARSLKFVGLG
jgi:[FeFe] hydrogenase H-cluster maturation GTPase HydF